MADKDPTEYKRQQGQSSSLHISNKQANPSQTRIGMKQNDNGSSIIDIHQTTIVSHIKQKAKRIDGVANYFPQNRIMEMDIASEAERPKYLSSELVH